MNRLLTGVAAGLVIWGVNLAWAGPEPGVAAKVGKRCGGCHAIPPGAGSDGPGFKPGSHAEHAQFDCERCHPQGETEIREGHINGTISLKAEIEYQHGTEVPWPSMGSGTCGGLGYPYPPTGCHVRMPDATCFWVPGKMCQSPAKP